MIPTSSTWEPRCKSDEVEASLNCQDGDLLAKRRVDLGGPSASPKKAKAPSAESSSLAPEARVAVVPPLLRADTTFSCVFPVVRDDLRATKILTDESVVSGVKYTHCSTCQEPIGDDEFHCPNCHESFERVSLFCCFFSSFRSAQVVGCAQGRDFEEHKQDCGRVDIDMSAQDEQNKKWDNVEMKDRRFHACKALLLDLETVLFLSFFLLFFFGLKQSIQRTTN